MVNGKRKLTCLSYFSKAIHNGKEAGQEIPHVHIHVIPRESGDGAGPVHSMFKNKPNVTNLDMSSIVEEIKKSLT